MRPPCITAKGLTAALPNWLTEGWSRSADKSQKAWRSETPMRPHAAGQHQCEIRLQRRALTPPVPWESGHARILKWPPRPHHARDGTYWVRNEAFTKVRSTSRRLGQHPRIYALIYPYIGRGMVPQAAKTDARPWAYCRTITRAERRGQSCRIGGAFCLPNAAPLSQSCPQLCYRWQRSWWDPGP